MIAPLQKIYINVHICIIRRLQFDLIAYLIECPFSDPAGDAITILHQMILDRLELSLDLDDVLDSPTTDDENLRQERGQMSSTAAPLEPEVDSSRDASTIAHAHRDSKKVYLTPRKNMVGCANNTAMAQGELLTGPSVESIPDNAAAADNRLEHGDGVNENIDVLKSDDHKHTVTFDQQLERYISVRYEWIEF